MPTLTPLCSEGGDQVVTVTAIGPNQALDVNVVGGGVAGGIAMMQVRNPVNAWTDVGWFAGNEEVPVLLYDGVNFIPVLPNWIQATMDEATNSLPVSAANYGFYPAGGLATQGRPFLVDLDDDAINSEQIPQIVIPLLYGFDENGQIWQRLHTDGANALNVNVVGGAFAINTEYVDDTPFTVEVNYTLSVGGVVTNDLVNPGDIGALRMSANRNLFTILTDNVDDLDVVKEGDAKVNGILGFGYNTTLNTVHAHRVVLPGDAVDFGFISYAENPTAGVVVPLPVVNIADGQTLGIASYTYNALAAVHQPQPVVAVGDPVDMGPLVYGMNGNLGATLALPIVGDVDPVVSEPYGIGVLGVHRGVPMPTWHYLPIETDGVGWGNFGIPIGGHDYGVPPSLYNTHRVDVNGFQYTAIVDSNTAIYNEIFGSMFMITQDETTNAIVTAAGNYAYYGGNPAATQAVPLLADLDDDAINPNQIPQIVIPLLYGYDYDNTQWQRLLTDGAGSLNVNIVGGGGVITINSEYVDDTPFVVEEDYILGIGGVVTDDLVNAGDIGALRMSLNRNLYTKLTDDVDVLDIVKEGDDKVNGILAFAYNTTLNTLHAHRVVLPGDAVDFGFISYGENQALGITIPIPITIAGDVLSDGITAYGFNSNANASAPLPLATDYDPYISEPYGIPVLGLHRGGPAPDLHPIPLEMDAVAWGGFSLPVGGHDYGGVPDVFFTHRVDQSGFQYGVIADSITGLFAEVDPIVLNPIGSDENANGLVTSSGCHGYFALNPPGTQAMPFLNEIDMDMIAPDQIPQLVIPLLYGFDYEGGLWQRLTTNGTGSLNVNLTGADVAVDMTIESPLNTGFKSFDHPNADVNRIVWQDPPYKDGRKNDQIPTVDKWKQFGVGASTYTTGVEFSGPYEGEYCLNLYDNSGIVNYYNTPRFDLGSPYPEAWLEPGTETDKVLVWEGRFYVTELQHELERYVFGITLYDPNAGGRLTYIIALIQGLPGEWDAHVATSDNTSVVVALTPTAGGLAGAGPHEFWNYFRLEIYPPNNPIAPGNFKRLVINGYAIPLVGFGAYAVVGAYPVYGTSLHAGKFMGDGMLNSLWDEFTFWTYREVVD